MKELEEAQAKLADSSAGWVTRRDAADLLGRIAQDAIRRLQQFAEDEDTDVRTAVQSALDALDQPPPMAASKPYSLRTLAESCHKPPARTVHPDGPGYVVEVQLKERRNQWVYIMPCERKDKTPLIQIYTYCGEPTSQVGTWALRNNRKLIHCAFAVHRSDNGKHLILIENMDQRLATPQRVKASVKEMALYGDWLEKKVTGLDDL